jgi:DNA-binding cell septation regulator SpoVG
MADLNKAVAAKLWDAVRVELDRFHTNLVKHPKSVFLGYADITLTIPRLEGFALKVRGIEIKLLKGNPFIAFPSERGADGTFYPQVFPKSGEMRAVLTTALFSDERVQAAVEAAAQMPEATEGTEGTEGAEASTSNPFSDPS